MAEPRMDLSAFVGRLPEEQARAERGGEAPVSCRGSQRPHMHVEFVGQDSERYLIVQ